MFIDQMIERSGPVYFRCHVDETLDHAALEIPDWMFDSKWSMVCVVDAPIVEWQALRGLKLLLTTSNHDPMVKEAEGFKGGADATDTEFKTVSIGAVQSNNSDSSVGNDAMGGEAKDDAITVTIVSSALGESTPSPEGGQP